MVDAAGTGATVVSGTPVSETGKSQGEQIDDMISNYVPAEAKGDESGKAGETELNEDGTPKVAEAEGVIAAEAAAVAAAGGKKPIEGAEAAGEKDQVIGALQQQIATLTAKIDQLTSGKPAEVKTEPATAKFTGEFFENKAEYDKSFEDQPTLNKVLGRVSQATAQLILSNLPQVVSNIVKSQVEVQSKVKDFFDSNKDLATHRQFVGFVSNDLMGKNPGWTTDKLFSELGKEVRTRIGLKQAAVIKGGKGTGGGFTPQKGGGARVPAAKTEALEGLQKEINDLIT